jgi:hypothetical protein
MEDLKLLCVLATSPRPVMSAGGDGGRAFRESSQPESDRTGLVVEQGCTALLEGERKRGKRETFLPVNAHSPT